VGDEHELSAESVQLIGDLLEPRLKESLREEFHKVREASARALASAELRIASDINEDRKRLQSLEGNQRKALFGLAGIVTVIQLGWNFAAEKIKSKLGWK
jgi:hypothetical protein